MRLNRDMKLGFIVDKAIAGKAVYFKLALINYDERSYTCSVSYMLMPRLQLLNALKSGTQVKLLNAKVTKDNKIVWGIPKFDINHTRDSVLHIATKTREYIEYMHGTGTDLCGECIRASEILVTALKFAGYNDCKTVEGWCEFDDDSSCSDAPYDPHTWVELANGRMYLDITADQFNTCMYRENKYPPVLLHKGLPHGMCYDEPAGWDDEEDDDYEE